MSKKGQLLLTESLTVRARALLGIEAAADASSGSSGGGSSGPHWSEHTAKQRLHEVMGRMEGDKRLHKKLLLHGIQL